MTWRTRCPAKLNLFLSVGPKDARGWHPLRTQFQAISLCDTLVVRVADFDTFDTNVGYLTGENTVTRALSRLRKEAEIPPLDIVLKKQIPAQSGLGGGSSDAAGLLRIAKQFLVPEMGDQTIMEIAADVGADIPFFLVGGAASAEGYGEKLTPLPDRRQMFFVVSKPEIDCSTPAMFRALDELDYPFRELPDDDCFYNDFERVMPDICRDQINLLFSLGACQAGLTGSGSAVYGVFETHTDAETAAILMVPSEKERVWSCHSLSRAECLQVSQTY